MTSLERCKYFFLSPECDIIELVDRLDFQSMLVELLTHNIEEVFNVFFDQTVIRRILFVVAYWLLHGCLQVGCMINLCRGSV